MSTPNMSLTLPAVSSTPGPEWATETNSNWSIVDGHDHTPGSGTQIPSAGLALDADLPFASFNATLLRSTRFVAQTVALAESTDLGCLYRVAGDLYWNNGDGTAVQITSGGSVVGSSGTIAGLPSGTASAAFVAGSGTFVFRQATNSAATMDAGPVVIRDTAVSAKGVTVQSPTSLAADYALTLFAALPASTKFVRVSSTGVLTDDTDTDNSSLEMSGSSIRVKALGVTRAMQAAVGQQLSSVGSGSVTAQVLTEITGLTVTITTSGRPVVIACVPDDSLGASGYWVLNTAAIGTSSLQLAVKVGVNTLASTTLQVYVPATNKQFKFAASTVWTVYPIAAGTYTFQVYGLVGVAGDSLVPSNVKLLCYEL